jgi:hypothetical protein
MMIGSKKYPIDRDVGHSCVTSPPAMIPGLTRIAVPVLLSYRENSGEWTRTGERYLYYSTIRHLLDQSQQADFIVCSHFLSMAFSSDHKIAHHGVPDSCLLDVFYLF